MAKAKRNYAIVNTRTHTHISIPKKQNDSATVQAPGRKVVIKKNGRAARYHHYNYYKKRVTGNKIGYKAKVLDKGNPYYRQNLNRYKSPKKRGGSRTTPGGGTHTIFS